MPAVPVLEKQRQAGPGAHWSDIVAESVSSKFNTRLCLKTQGGQCLKMTLKMTFDSSPIYAHACTSTNPHTSHTCMCKYTYIAKTAIAVPGCYLILNLSGEECVPMHVLTVKFTSLWQASGLSVSVSPIDYWPEDIFASVSFEKQKMISQDLSNDIHSTDEMVFVPGGKVAFAMLRQTLEEHFFPFQLINLFAQ